MEYEEKENITVRRGRMDVKRRRKGAKNKGKDEPGDREMPVTR